jgi:hypothetical protein
MQDKTISWHIHSQLAKARYMPDDSDCVEIECHDDDERVVVVSSHEYIEYEILSDSFLRHMPAPGRHETDVFHFGVHYVPACDQPLFQQVMGRVLNSSAKVHREVFHDHCERNSTNARDPFC